MLTPPGTVEAIFPEYLEHLDDALENFCDRHWPCEYIKPSGGARCVNVRSGHGAKGHQTKDGKVIAVGDYVSTFSFEANQEEFRCNVYYRLKELLDLLRGRVKEGEQDEQSAAQIHRHDVMPHFYQYATKGGQAAESYNSHTACFCCLFEAPEHVLSCGHILCTPCLRAYGDSNGTVMVDIYECPIHSGTARRWQNSRFYLKPKTAGIRILTLDGYISLYHALPYPELTVAVAV